MLYFTRNHGPTGQPTVRRFIATIRAPVMRLYAHLAVSWTLATSQLVTG